MVNASLRTDLLKPYQRPIICIFDVPTLHAGDLLLGGSEQDVRLFFGQGALATDDRDYRKKKCLQYPYSRSVDLTLLLDGGCVTRTWVTPPSEVPAPCAGILSEAVSVPARSPWVAVYY